MVKTRIRSDEGDNPSGGEILTRFRQFKRVLPSICLKLHWDPTRLRFVDYAFAVASWTSANPL